MTLLTLNQTKALGRPDSKRSSTPVAANAFCTTHIRMPAMINPEIIEVTTFAKAYCAFHFCPLTNQLYEKQAKPAKAPEIDTVRKFQDLYKKKIKASSAPIPCIIPIIKDEPTPHWQPNKSSTNAASVSANKAAPGLRTINAAKGPANSQKPLHKPSAPGKRLAQKPIGAAQTMSQAQNNTPDATAIIAAITISITRQRLECFTSEFSTIDIVSAFLSMNR